MNLTPPPHTTPSFAKSAIPLQLLIKPSRIGIATIAALHCIALFAVTVAAIGILIQLVLWAVILFSFFYNIKQELKPRHIIWRAGNHWIINHDPAQPRTSTLKAIDFLSRWLVIITLHEDNGRQSRLVIPCDAVDADKFRLFRVRLRIEGHGLLNPEQEDP